MRLEGQLLNHLHDGAVDRAENELRINAKNKHERKRGQNRQDFLEAKVGQLPPPFIERPVEHPLQYREHENCRNEKAND